MKTTFAIVTAVVLGLALLALVYSAGGCHDISIGRALILARCR